MELPAAFIRYTRSLLGDAEYRPLSDALAQEQPVSIRLNEGKLPSHLHASILASSAPVPWASAGCYLHHRPTFTFDPLFHAGCYYVQEAASMFVEQVLRQHVGSEPSVMLDLCAAPGGKSTLACSLLSPGSLLVANEVIRNRSQILAENLTKWGRPNVVVTNNDPADFAPLQDFFDVILTDVPCSGEGMFRKDSVAVSEWSPENVELCRQRQQRIVADIWPCLKPGGLFIYSTCTYNTKEDEENIRWMRQELGAEVLPLEVPREWNITGNLLSGEDFPVYRFLPHKTKGEGFFLAVLRKPGEGGVGLGVTEAEITADVSETSACVSQSRVERPSAQGRVSLSPGLGISQPRGKMRSAQGKGKPAQGKGKTAPGLSKEQLATLRPWLLAPDEYEFIVNGSSVSAFPKNYLPELSAFRSSLRIVQAGVAVAELKGKDWLPAHALAMSTILHSNAFPHEEVTYEQAIAYLRKEAVVLSETTPRGIVLLTYRNIPLGFVKNIGNRANNLYPQEWRIRSGYLPEEIVELAVSAL